VDARRDVAASGAKPTRRARAGGGDEPTPALATDPSARSVAAPASWPRNAVRAATIASGVLNRIANQSSLALGHRATQRPPLVASSARRTPARSRRRPTQTRCSATRAHTLGAPHMYLPAAGGPHELTPVPASRFAGLRTHLVPEDVLDIGIIAETGVELSRGGPRDLSGRRRPADRPASAGPFSGPRHDSTKQRGVVSQTNIRQHQHWGRQGGLMSLRAPRARRHPPPLRPPGRDHRRGAAAGGFSGRGR